MCQIATVSFYINWHLKMSSAKRRPFCPDPISSWLMHTHIAKKKYPTKLANTSNWHLFMGPTWGPPGSCRPQMGPMLAPWTDIAQPAAVTTCCEYFRENGRCYNRRRIIISASRCPEPPAVYKANTTYVDANKGKNATYECWGGYVVNIFNHDVTTFAATCGPDLTWEIPTTECQGKSMYSDVT